MPESSDKAVHAGHRARLRNRFAAGGLDDFADHEILELLLTYALPQKDVNPLAHSLLQHFGTLSNCMDASVQELEQIHGISTYTATFLSLIPQVTRRYLRSKWEDKPTFTTMFAAGQFVSTLFVDANVEQLYAICLNAQGSLLSFEMLHEGSLDSLPASGRSLITCAIKNRAHSMIIAHNHPSGSIVPSQTDFITTRKLIAALTLAEIPLLDHVVVAKGCFYSMRMRAAGNAQGKRIPVEMPSYADSFADLFEYSSYIDLIDKWDSSENSRNKKD